MTILPLGKLTTLALLVLTAPWASAADRPPADPRAPRARVEVTRTAPLVFTLDGRGSATAGEPRPAYHWTVPGATFVDGTTAESAVARVRLDDPDSAVAALLEVRGNGSRDTSVHILQGGDDQGPAVGGEPIAWHPLEIVFRGPASHQEAAGPNPFLDYRLVVTFTGPSRQTYRVHGFFDGDGRGGGTGQVWRVRFAPDEGGEWAWRASFRTGSGIAVDPDTEAGSPVPPNGAGGRIHVLDRRVDASGFLSRGRLEHAGSHYLRFAEGGWFLKGGTNSPENLFGYDGFDGVVDQGGIGIIHRYQPHVNDWRPGDPVFSSSSSGWDSRGILGALNYLGARGVNSVYFLPMNLGGDGQETCPFTGYDKNEHDRTHYDVGRLAQWNVVLEHAQRQGILVQFVLSETEWGNENWLDGGGFGVQRKLLFRELVARFGHVLGIKWNLGEENDFPVDVLEDMATWLDWLDPYDHPIAVHNHVGDFSDYYHFAGDPLFSATSIQYGADQAGALVEKWREVSANAGRPWVIDMDENAPAGEGLTDANHHDLRKRVLWDVYLSGGNIEWYLGYHSLPLGGDVKLEDFRTREAMWNFMRHARAFLEALPFWEMEPADGLLSGESSSYGGAEVFAKPGEVYAIYLPDASLGGVLDLTQTTGKFAGRWFDPREGSFTGSPQTLVGGKQQSLGLPPEKITEDWAYLVSVQ